MDKAKKFRNQYLGRILRGELNTKADKMTCGELLDDVLRHAEEAVWGLDWLAELVESGNAINLGGDGYPLRFTATAEYLVPQIKQFPEARSTWLYDAHDILTGKWSGKTVVDRPRSRSAGLGMVACGGMG